MLYISSPPCDIISVLSCVILSLMSSSVALGDQTAAVALVINPLTFWAKAKAEPVSSLGQRAKGVSQQRSDVYLSI